ncbi:MAG: cell division protein FtsA [Bacteroidales bacterium]|nr:cell division protein FtsA [Bacteroidales bacterium]
MKKRKLELEPEEQKGPQMVVGLDIGTTKIVMVMGYLCDDGKVEVCGYGKAPSTGVEYGLVLNVQDTIDGIMSAKTQVEAATNHPVKSAYVGIAGRHIKSISCNHSITRINGRDVIIRKEEIDQMNADMERFEVSFGKVIAVIPQNFKIDGVDTLRPVGRVGQNITATYQLITGDAFEIRKIIMCVQESGLQMDKLLLEPLASSISCLTEEEKKNGVALIDIGGGTTDLIIYRSGVPVHIRVIPIGGQVITKDIQALGMTYEEAEQIKIDHGSCVPENADKDHFITLKNSIYYGQNVKINERDLAKVINPRVVRDILEPVKAEIEKSGYKDDIMRVVITGGGSRLKDIKSLAEFVFQRKVRIGIPGVGFTQTLESTLKDPTYSTALGLLAHGCKCMAQPYTAIDTKTNEPENIDEIPEGDDTTRKGFRLLSAITSGFDKILDSLTETGGSEGVD